MLQGWVIVLVSFAYLGVLFAIAYYGDKRAEARRSIIANPYIYALSLAVYCTTWTFYGSVGRAASSGIGFLPVYLGPTLMMALWWFVMRKIIRISKTYRITSIADFVASRYGKSQLLGGLVTVIAVLGVIPYISLQLKAISGSFTILLHYPQIVMPAKAGAQPFLGDTALYIAMTLAAFTILFGARHLDATERHEGLVAAIAFESLVKLLAFLAVGGFITFGIYHGFGDIFRLARQVRHAPLMTGAGISHAGLALMLVGVVTTSAFDRTASVTLEPGEPGEALGHTFTLQRYVPTRGAMEPHFEIDVVPSGGDPFTATPVMFRDGRRDNTIARPHIHRRILGDLYVAPVRHSPGEEPERRASLARGAAGSWGPYTLTFLRFQSHAQGEGSMTVGAVVDVGRDGRTEPVIIANQIVI